MGLRIFTILIIPILIHFFNLQVVLGPSHPLSLITSIALARHGAAINVNLVVVRHLPNFILIAVIRVAIKIGPVAQSTLIISAVIYRQIISTW